MKILCAWELGDNLGHLVRLSAVTDELLGHDHTVSAALADLGRASSFFRCEAVCLLQSPVFRQKLKMNRQLASLADVLTLHGYINREGLLGLVAGWESLIQLTGAELLIADHAPSALLAALRLGIPALIIGNGFTLPQAGEPLPDWRPVPLRGDQVVSIQEGAVLQTINALLPAGQALERLSELYRCRKVLIDGFPLLDLQAGLRKGAVHCAGPPASGRGSGGMFPGEGGSAGARAPWFVNSSRSRIGAYLHPSYGRINELCSALAGTEADVVVVCPGAADEMVARFKGAKGMHLINQVVDLESLIAASDWFISHGGLGSTTQCLRQGKAQIVFPTQMEQLNNALLLQQAGLARIVPELESPDAYRDALKVNTPGPDMQSCAAVFPTQHGASMSQSLGSAVADAVAALSGHRAPPAVPPSRP